MAGYKRKAEYFDEDEESEDEDSQNAKRLHYESHCTGCNCESHCTGCNCQDSDEDDGHDGEDDHDDGQGEGDEYEGGDYDDGEGQDDEYEDQDEEDAICRKCNGEHPTSSCETYYTETQSECRRCNLGLHHYSFKCQEWA